MKNRNLLLIFIVLFRVCVGQDIKVTHNVINNFESVNTADVSFDKRDKLFRMQSKDVIRNKVGNDVLTRKRGGVLLKTNEELLGISNNGVYTSRHKGDRIKEFVKSLNGVEIGHLEMDIEGDFQLVDEMGYAIYCDFMDGAATNFSFFSPDLNLLNSYIPYEGGFNRTIFGFSSELVCIFSQKEDYSSSYKLSVLDHKGNLIVSKEMDRGGFIASDLKITNNKILLLMNSTQSTSTKLLVFNTDLTKEWQKEIPRRVVNYKLVKSEKSNSVLLCTQDVIECLSLKNGINLWSLPVNQLIEQDGDARQIEVEYVFDDKYVAINVGGFQSNTKNTVGNNLFLMKHNNGAKVYMEKIGASKSEIKILGKTNGFFLMKDSEVRSYNIQ